MAGNGTGMWGVMHHDATSRAGVLREGAVAAADPLAALETLAARMPAARGGGVRAAAGRPVLRQRTEAGGGGGGGSQDPAGLLPQIGRRSNNAQVTPKAVAQGGGSRIVRPGLFPPDPMPMLGGGGLGGGGLGGGGGGDSDARVRGLERQCKDLREEQRQLAAWLSKTQEQLGSEAAARQQLEAQLLRLEQHVGVSNSELSARVGQTERQSVKLQDALSWSQNTMQDAVTKVANDVGAHRCRSAPTTSAARLTPAWPTRKVRPTTPRPAPLILDRAVVLSHAATSLQARRWRRRRQLRAVRTRHSSRPRMPRRARARWRAMCSGKPSS
jgi:hypothetical protein